MASEAKEIKASVINKPAQTDGVTDTWEFLPKTPGKLNPTKVQMTMSRQARGKSNIVLEGGTIYSTNDLETAAEIYIKPQIAKLLKGDEGKLKAFIAEAADRNKIKLESTKKLANVAELLKELTK